MFTSKPELLPIEPKDYHSIGNLLQLPVYNDVLGMEYEKLESIENQDIEWNSRLLQLADKIAKKQDMDIYQVSSLLSDAENATESDKVELIGGYLLDFNKLMSERPSESAKTLEIATIVLKTRVNPDITTENVRLLPRKYIQEIYDFLVQEQQSGQFIGRQQLESELEFYKETYNRSKELADILSELQSKSTLAKAKKEQIANALSRWGATGSEKKT